MLWLWPFHGDGALDKFRNKTNIMDIAVNCTNRLHIRPSRQGDDRPKGCA